MEFVEFPNRPVAQLLGAGGPIHAVSYSASPGTYILAGSADRSIRLYNPASATVSTSGTGTSSSGHIGAGAGSGSGPGPRTNAAPIPERRLIQTYSAHGYEVLSLAIAPDNARFASAGGDRSVFLWDVSTAQTIRRFAGHSSRVNSVAFAGTEGSLVVSGGFDTTVRVWDTKSGSGKPVQVFGEARDAVSAVAVTGAEIVAGSVDGRVRSYDVRMGRVVTDVVGASVTSLAVGRDGKTVLVGALDSKLRLMDRENGACLKAYGDKGWRNEELRVQAVLGGKERFIVAGDEMTAEEGSEGEEWPAGCGRVWAWDVLSGKVVAKLPVPWGPTAGSGPRKTVGRDGREKERKNVVSCLAWKEGGFGDQFCVGGTSGVVTVFGPRDKKG